MACVALEAPIAASQQLPEEAYIKTHGFQFRRALAHPPLGDEVVISGLAGMFPDSRDIYHFRDNLMSKKDLISDDCRRWDLVHPEIPKRHGKLFDIEKYDAGFFGTHYRQATSMDPMARLFVERAIEAVLDAGLHPSELENTRTAVFVGACFCESEKSWFFDKLWTQYYGITGCIRSMIANRVSYFLKLRGPSCTVDTACSSSLIAIQHAYDAIRNDECDAAIVGGTNVCMHPYVSLQFARLGVLSPDGRCKVFDAKGDGYARSEAICAAMIQKAKDARRIYSYVLHAKTNCDGYKPQGITFPSGPVQKQLLEEFYQECDYDPTTLSFLEAHGTGTKVGDPEEIAAIDEIFCKKREKPLLIGSVKSSIGHSEPSSGLCSITKVVLAMETGLILPNINYEAPREGVEALENGRLKVVTENTPWQDTKGLVGVNSFGFGGANCHVLLKWNEKAKVNQGLPHDDLPRLICVSGRVEASVSAILDDLKGRKLDAELVGLYHQVFKKDIGGHNERGFAVISKSNGELKRSVERCRFPAKPLCLVFSDFGSSLLKVANDLYVLPIFAASLQRIHKILVNNGIDSKELVLNGTCPGFDSGFVEILGTAIVQIGIVDILKKLNIVPDAYLGKGTGEFICAYLDEALDLQETVLSILLVAKILSNYRTASYLVKVKKDQINPLPPFVHISELGADGIVLTGAVEEIRSFVSALKKRGVQIEAVNENNLDFRRANYAHLRPQLLKGLLNIITKPRPRTSKWLSSSVSKSVAADHFANVMCGNISTKQTMNKIRGGSAVLEIGSNLRKLSQPRKQETLIPFVKAFCPENVFVCLLKTVGSLYLLGHNPQVAKLYPKIQYPVSKGTPMISPLIKWDHHQDWFVTYYNPRDCSKTRERCTWVVLRDVDWVFAAGHIIDGRTLFPATGYLTLVWETLACAEGMIMSDMRIVFEDVRFMRATTVSQEAKVEFIMMVQRGSGNFEVIESNTAIVTGRITIVNDFSKEHVTLPLPLPTPPEEALPLQRKDIYKELRLRGYNYKGDFRNLMECDNSACVGKIRWVGDFSTCASWITFMDHMLQMKILQIDTRLLYVPTGIKRLALDTKAHIAYVQSFGEEADVPVYVYKDSGVIKSGGIEIRGLSASSIAKRKPRGDPVLEKYEFVPNIADLSISDSVRVNVQLVIENLPAIKVNTVELIDEATPEGSEPLSLIIHEILGDLPLIQPNITILTKEQVRKISGVTVEDKKLVAETDCTLIVGTNILQRSIQLQQALGAIRPGGFILSRESSDFEPSSVNLSGIVIVTVHSTPREKMILFKKAVDFKPLTVVEVFEASGGNFEWLQTLQNAVKADPNVIVFTQKEPLSGVLGLVNCLRREPGFVSARSVFVVDEEAPPFDLSNSFYSEHLKKNLAVNVFKDNQWGTYRHLLLEESLYTEHEHSFVNFITKGDLSSLRWIQGKLYGSMKLPPERKLVHVYYTALNFRDIMIASGRLNADVVTPYRLKQECTLGFEFSGRNSAGQRVFGMEVGGALSTMVDADAHLLWKVPKDWSLEDAATVPVVFGTCIYALYMTCPIKRGQSILIHAGSGGIGSAAITLALHEGLTVYTTVGTSEKREFVKKCFPQLLDQHIGNSRDTTFEQMIMIQTGGIGVDLVLNSLSDEKMQASIRCLAKGGSFLEIGKYDLANNTALKLLLLEREASFYGIMLDCFFAGQTKTVLSEIMLKLIRNGAVKPLPRTIFKEDEVEQAFRFMAGGKHMGKVLVALREEEEEDVVVPRPKIIKSLMRYHCNENSVYVIVGGLGGFGLEIADWLVVRGARKLVLSSRQGIKTGYQSLRVKTWIGYGADVHISTSDITTKAGCEEMLQEASGYGDVEAIFNLAVVLKDGIFENQSPENFIKSFEPKALATQYLDGASRMFCKNLRDFVVFSSVSCGRGNAGQTNYGMANSVMERICEKRRREGFPAVAIEWGAIGEVGLVAEMQEEYVEIEIGGTLQQNISSCLDVMDRLLRQENPIVSSMVVAEKRSGSGGADNVVDAVANLMGLKSLKTISMHATLAELGMDSMTAVEIKQTLEREFDVFLTAQDIRNMTFARLYEIQEEKALDASSGQTKDKPLRGFDMLIRLLNDEETAKLPVVKLGTSTAVVPKAPRAILFPGIEGVAKVLEPLAHNLKVNPICVQFSGENPKDTVVEMAEAYLPVVEALIFKDKPFIFIAYSFGALVALEIAAALEKNGYKGSIFSIDGAPELMCTIIKTNVDVSQEAVFQTAFIIQLMSLYVSDDVVFKQRDRIYRCNNLEERLEICDEIIPKNIPHSRAYLRRVAVALYKRSKSLGTYEPSYTELKSKITLFKPDSPSVTGMAEDYSLGRLCENSVEVEVVPGNHATMLSNAKMAHSINRALGVEDISEEIADEEPEVLQLGTATTECPKKGSVAEDQEVKVVANSNLKQARLKGDVSKVSIPEGRCY